MEVTSTTEAFEVAESSAVGEARRRAHTLARLAGFDEARASDVALVATEAASNVVKHAGHGGVLLGVTRVGDAQGVTVTAWDRGPGMDLERCLRDGMSTAGTAGVGLGAIARLATSWNAYTHPGAGVVIAATIFPHGVGLPAVDVAGVSVPIPGELECGDAWAGFVSDASVTLVACDGLGHGPAAALASKTVLDAFRARPLDSPAAILENANGPARGTRGAATTVVRVDRATRIATIAGVGNVAAFVWSAVKLRPMVTQHGTLGQAIPKLREERYELPAGALLVLCTDGLRSRIDLGEHHQLAERAAATIASVLWRDFTRGRDDSTVVVLRLEPRA